MNAVVKCAQYITSKENKISSK